MFKACYSVFNNRAKGFSINCINMLCLLSIQAESLYFLHTHELSGVPTTRNRRDLSQENEEARQSKISRNYPIISKVRTKQCLHWAGNVRWCAILHGDCSL
ncbi:hypothetical protein AVEN_193446-1 [Araneus ventricosus]|uniref:Uncharacterized protein n=1 Tax=Araneus ventricosus TaxID=182803 RepID=A0A4Y2G4H5_ARAVE|nr:hypothetical protein AVEN_193446-1 [Araneus ventricosus]